MVFAEMQQSDQKRVGFFLNDGGGENWRLEVVARTGSHNIRVADIQTTYQTWSERGAQFLTPPIDRGPETRCASPCDLGATSTG